MSRTCLKSPTDTLFMKLYVQCFHDQISNQQSIEETLKTITSQLLTLWKSYYFKETKTNKKINQNKQQGISYKTKYKR